MRSYQLKNIISILDQSSNNGGVCVCVSHSITVEYIIINNLHTEDTTWLKPDDVNNIGVHAIPRVFCTRFIYDIILPISPPYM